MLKRTPGKWKWDFSKDPETFGKPGIFVEGKGELSSVQLGDLVLMAHAPEMYETLWEVVDSFNSALNKGFLQKDKKDIIYIAEKISILLRNINVERQNKNKEAQK